MDKKCKKCGLASLNKNWFKRGRQMYKCSSCWYVFQNKSREKEIRKEGIWKKFVYRKQTYEQLASEYSVSIKTVQRAIKDKTILVETKKKWSTYRDHYGYNVLWKKIWYNGIQRLSQQKEYTLLWGRLGN